MSNWTVSTLILVASIVAFVVIVVLGVIQIGLILKSAGVI